MRSTGDAFKLSNVAAASYTFVLEGGYYQTAVVSTFGGGSVQLNMLGPDNTTYLAIGASITANGVQLNYLPPGSYEIVITTATASYVSVVRVPLD